MPVRENVWNSVPAPQSPQSAVGKRGARYVPPPSPAWEGRGTGAAYAGNFSLPIDLWALEHETRNYLRAGFLLGISLLVVLLVVVAAPGNQAMFTTGSGRARVIFADIRIIPPRPRQTPVMVRPVTTRAPRTIFPPVFKAGASLPEQTGMPGRGISPLLADQPGAPSFEPLKSGVPAPDARTGIELPGMSGGDRVLERNTVADGPLREEMLVPLDFLDAREAKRIGLIEYNPSNKFSIRGIVPLMVALANNGDSLSERMHQFRDGVEKYTDIDISMIRCIHITDNSPWDYPFLYISKPADSDALSAEARSIGDYIRGGGFVLFESAPTNYTAGETADSFGDQASGALVAGSLTGRPAPAGDMYRFIRRALGAEGVLRPIPNDHPLYSCYFDFPDGPPVTPEGSQLNGTGRATSVPLLYGVWLDGRLAAVFSDKSYGLRWDETTYGSAAIRMVINIFVYALRESSGSVMKRRDYTLLPGARAQYSEMAEELKLPPEKIKVTLSGANEAAQ